LRGRYDQWFVQIEAQARLQHSAALRSQLIALEGLQKRLTMQGDVEGAVKVRDERQAIGIERAALEQGAAAAGEARPQGSAPSATPSLIHPPASPVVAPQAGATPGVMPPATRPLASRVAATPTPASARKAAASPSPAPAPAAMTMADKTNPAVVQVTGQHAVPLAAEPEKRYGWEVVSEDWNGASIFLDPKYSSPWVEFSVVKAGRVYVACNFVSQGNSGGGWKEEVFGKNDYLRDGWTLVLSKLKLWKHADMVIFTKVLPAGTTLKLRCNKYLAPQVITF
jgi:hypothetical protein